MAHFPDLAYWAQHADNVSPDHYQWEGEGLPEGEPRRNDVQSAVFSVTKEGRELSRDGGNRVVLNDDRFVIQSAGADRDVAGRITPLVVVGKIPAHADEDWKDSVVKGAEDFLDRLDDLDRDTSDARMGAIGRALDALVEKKKAQRRRRVASLVLLLLLVALWAFVRSGEDAGPLNLDPTTQQGP